MPSKNPVCSDWLVFKGLSRQRPLCFSTTAVLGTWSAVVTVLDGISTILTAYLKAQFLNT